MVSVIFRFPPEVEEAGWQRLHQTMAPLGDDKEPGAVLHRVFDIGGSQGVGLWHLRANPAFSPAKTKQQFHFKKYLQPSAARR